MSSTFIKEQERRRDVIWMMKFNDVTAVIAAHVNIDTNSAAKKLKLPAKEIMAIAPFTRQCDHPKA